MNILDQMFTKAGVAFTRDVLVAHGEKKTRMDLLLHLLTGTMWIDVTVTKHPNKQMSLTLELELRMPSGTRWRKAAVNQGICFPPFVIDPFGARSACQILTLLHQLAAT